MSKLRPTHLMDHLTNPAFVDRPSQIDRPRKDHRLSYSYRVTKGSWNDVAKLIAEKGRIRPSWFPDANVAFLDQTTPVWDALRQCAREWKYRSTRMTAPVIAEMLDWLEVPHHHENRAKDIRYALTQNTWAQKLVFDKGAPTLTALQAYTLLLGKRRELAILESDGLSVFGTDPAKKSDTMNAIGNKIGLRAQGLAKKGRRDIEANKKINVRDEAHCLMAIFQAIRSGVDTVVITADEDYLEIFHKAQWFIDTHYRAWLAAPLIAKGTFGRPEKEVPDPYGFFDEPITLYRAKSNVFNEVLPPYYQTVYSGVIYVAPDDKIHHVGFHFERNIQGMLATRSKTNGRCTDLFVDRNIHIDLGPLKPHLGGLFIGVGRDRGSLTKLEGNEQIFISSLDVEHAISCQERHVAL